LTIQAWGCDCFRACYKKCSGRIDAQSTTSGVRGRHGAIVRSWNVERELKHRLWHPFWNSLLLKKCGDDVAGALALPLRLPAARACARALRDWCDAARRLVFARARRERTLTTTHHSVPSTAVLLPAPRFARLFVTLLRRAHDRAHEQDEGVRRDAHSEPLGAGGN
jgi:hypothetical protein